MSGGSTDRDLRPLEKPARHLGRLCSRYTDPAEAAVGAVGLMLRVLTPPDRIRALLLIADAVGEVGSEMEIAPQELGR